MISPSSGDRKASRASSKASTASQSSATVEEDGIRNGGSPKVATADAPSKLARAIVRSPTDELPDQVIADHARESDMAEVVRRALDRLPQRMRAAVMLRYFEDMTEPEIAATLGISLGT